MAKESTWDTASNRQAEIGVGLSYLPTDPYSMTESEWIQRHRASWTSSTEWLEANLRKQWENNLRTFNQRHPTGSKYYGQDYRHRSKYFRPKSRAAVRSAEARAASAFFASEGLVTVEANDPDDEVQLASAAINKALLDQRLNAKPIEWFLTVLGAFQDTQTMGICVSKQYWCYEQQMVNERALATDPVTGLPLLDENGEPQYRTAIVGGDVKKDEPRIDLVAAENFRIDAGASWIDPVNTSPYAIEAIPMFVGDVKQRMQVADPKTGRPQWIQRSDAEIMSARTHEYNSTRQAREDYREDSKENRRNYLYDHDIVWVHETAMRINGQDWHYFTLGIEYMLSVPQPLNNYYYSGDRPWVMGISNIESHKVYPASKIQLGEQLQREINENANQRMDNVRFAMNPRIFYRLGSSVDLGNLKRSTPGNPVGMKTPAGPDADVFIDRPPEVTRSAYEEQDRLNQDFDEITGAFSVSSVQSNRQLNETVGGMKMIRAGSNEITTLDLTLFNLTWAEPVIRQLIRLEQAYESDPVLLATAGKKAKLWQRFGINRITDKLLQGEFTTTVNVGIGAPDPVSKFQDFSIYVKGLMEIWGEEAPRVLNRVELSREAASILGYRDGDRFLMVDEEDPETQQLQMVIDQLMSMLSETQREGELKVAIEKMKQQGSLAKQAMGDRTKILTELLKSDTQRTMQEGQLRANAAGQMFQSAQQARESRADRDHQTGLKQFDLAARAQQGQPTNGARRGNGAAA